MPNNNPNIFNTGPGVPDRNYQDVASMVASVDEQDPAPGFDRSTITPWATVMANTWHVLNNRYTISPQTSCAITDDRYHNTLQVNNTGSSSPTRQLARNTIGTWVFGDSSAPNVSGTNYRMANFALRHWNQWDQYRVDMPVKALSSIGTFESLTDYVNNTMTLVYTEEEINSITEDPSGVTEENTADLRLLQRYVPTSPDITSSIARAVVNNINFFTAGIASRGVGSLCFQALCLPVAYMSYEINRIAYSNDLTVSRNTDVKYGGFNHSWGDMVDPDLLSPADSGRTSYDGETIEFLTGTSYIDWLNAVFVDQYSGQLSDTRDNPTQTNNYASPGQRIYRGTYDVAIRQTNSANTIGSSVFIYVPNFSVRTFTI